MKDYIKKIVDNGKKEEMECLSDILIDLMYELKENNHEEYDKYKRKLKGMAYNYTIDEEMAHKIVEEMKPYGEYWNMETIKSVIGVDQHRTEDMYVVMNSLVNDYSGAISPEEVDTYIKLADLWIDDEDGKKHKIWWYFVK